jgi:hypothetical protein
LAFGCTPTAKNNPGSGGSHSGGSNSGGSNSGGNPGQGGSSASGGHASSGGSNASGGANSGGSSSGGSNSGGSSSGGSNQGGSSSGGSNSGGSSSGGSNQGGSSSGGSNQGGSSSGGSNQGGSNQGGSSSGGSNQGGSNQGGSSSGGSNQGGSSSGGSNQGGSGSGGSGSGGSNKGGTTGTGGGTGTGGCTNTDPSSINIDSSGYVCGNSLGIKGAWYCYTTDTSNACNKTGAIPWNSSSNAMCLSGTIVNGGTALIGFKVNSGPPGSTGFNAWDASKLVGFAITFASGSSGKGSGGSVLYIEYPTTTNADTNTKDYPGVTVPGVAGASVTYNALFSDAVWANNETTRKTVAVDQANLTDVKISIPFDSQSRAYDFCITKVVPLTTAPGTVVPTGAYGPAWSNSLPQTVNGINGYAVQSTPFDKNNGLPMSMQVSATSGGVGFAYTAKSGASSGSMPAAFPAVISGWGPGEGGIQLYGPYQADKTIGSLQSITSSWSFTVGSSGDAAYDIWLGPSKQPTTAPAVELMIWINNGGKQPIGGGGAGAGAAVTGSDGVSRTPYIGQNTTNQRVISYVGTTSSSSVSNFDVLAYIKDAVSHSNYAPGLPTPLSGSYYLLGVQTGFEVYSADTWTTTSYNITIK